MRGLSTDENRMLLLSIGSHRDRRPYSPFEVARCFRKARDAGLSLHECAKAVHFDGSSMVSRFLRLYNLNPEIHHLVDWGQSGSTIAFTAASELSRLSTDDQVHACRAILEKQLSSSEVRQLVQLRLRSKKPLDECIQGVLRLRPQIQKRYLVIGAVTSGELRAKLSEFVQAQRDELLRTVLRKWVPQLRDLSSRLGVERFTIVSDTDVAKLIQDSDRDFEHIINAELMALVGKAAES